ncbi:MAG: hypothetical protein Nk1A_2950 [Endomicrobiia bacterium]|nr:MAG: hypothetical protein Nk1A_2950 [Endomicrobiia bacterium]
MDKIIFFHMNQLGDLLFSLPVLKAVRQELNVKICSVVRSTLAPLLLSSNLVDAIIPKNGNFIKNIETIGKEKFDKAILFSESPSSLILAYFGKIKVRVGFETSPLSFLLNRKIKRFGVPSLFNNRKLGFSVGLKVIQGDYVGILNVPESNLNNAKKWFRENNLDVEKTIAISPGASRKRQDKCLEDDKWVKVIDTLSQYGLKCILSGATWESGLLNRIAEKCKVPTRIFVASKGILDSAAFLKMCNLFVGIDSGAMHLAAAVGTRCVGMFGYTDPLQTGPMPIGRHIIIKRNEISKITLEDIISEVRNCRLE